MKRKVMVWTGCVLTGLLMAASAAHGDDGDKKDEAKTGTIMVSATGFKGKKGHAMVALYRGGKNWLTPSKAFRKEIVPIKDGQIRVTLRDVPYDDYGLTVLHDANKNGTMDMRYFPYPKPEEGGGVSNNWVRKGKPEYAKAKFELSRALMSVRIKMVYP